MELRIFVEPQQGASYEQQLAVAQAAEALGFDAFFRSDHYLKMGDMTGLPGPTDSWVTLGAIARETSTIRLGTLVTSATFRDPGLLAISVAQVDAMSNGRVELGLGAGWYEQEHTAYGFHFPDTRERFDRLEEQLAIITGLWRTPEGSTYHHDGVHWTLSESPALPKPVQRPHPPIIIGGKGPRRTPAMTARYSSEYNVPFCTLEETVALQPGVDAACESIGRNPAEIVRSAAQVVCVGVDAAEVARRAGIIGREPEELRENGLGGTPQQLVDKLGRFRDEGITRVYLQLLDIDDIEQLELLAAEVLPAVRD